MDIPFNLKPYDKILVLDKNDVWRPAVFSHYLGGNHEYSIAIMQFSLRPEPFVTHFCYAVPYEGHEELAGTEKS
jgi:hypothetical protein